MMTEPLTMLVVGHDEQTLRDIHALFAQADMAMAIEPVASQILLAEQLISRSWDLLLTDHRPDLDAGEVLALAAVNTPGLPLIVLANTVLDVQTTTRLIETGAQDVLGEIDAVLLAVVRRCLRQ